MLFLFFQCCFRKQHWSPSCFRPRRCWSSSYWTVYKFFASQSQRNIYNTNFLFPAKQKTAQFFPFLFCFTRELNPYSPPGRANSNPHPPRALSLWLNRVARRSEQALAFKDSTNPYPHPPPRAFRLYKTFGFTHPPIRSPSTHEPRFEETNFITTQTL